MDFYDGKALFILLVCFTKVFVAGGHACDQGWTAVNGQCYYFSRFQLNFYAALSFCNVYGGKLAEIDGYNELVILSRMARHRGHDSYWIGLTDLFGEGIWLKATTLKKQVFTRWNSGEPNNKRGEHCASASSYLQSWNDLSCHNTLKFICEK